MATASIFAATSRAPFSAGAAGALVALLFASCTPNPPVSPAPPPAPSPPAAAPSRPTASASIRSDPWLGMYVARNGDEDSAWWFFAPRPAGAWLVTTTVPNGGNRIAKVTLEPRSDGWSLEPGVGGDASAFLRRPAHEGEPWSLAFGEGSAPQRLDADTASLAARLSSGVRFVRIDDRHAPRPARVEDAYTKDAIDVLDGMFTRLEIARHEEVSCYLDVLIPLLYRERGSRPSPAVDARVPVDVHAVHYVLLKTGRHCPDSFDRDGSLEGPELGKDAGVTVFVRAGDPLGAVVVSYMYAGLFVAPGASWKDVAAMRPVAEEAASEQAE